MRTRTCKKTLPKNFFELKRYPDLKSSGSMLKPNFQGVFEYGK